MKTTSFVLLAAAGVLAFSLGLGRANPPAPCNLISGMVRDQYGTPLTTTNARVLLRTPAGAVITGQVLPNYAPGLNYLLRVPMDAGLSPDRYMAGAQLGGAQYQLWVVVNGATNLPIEMTGSYDALGKPGAQARINLTLGVDSNGDGIPDAWETAFLQSLGLNLPLSALNANSVLGATGLTLRQEYLFGAYPYNPAMPCSITFSGFHAGSPDLTFPTVNGRTYTVLVSSDTRTWTTVGFRLATDAPSAPARSSYYSGAAGTVEVYVAPPAGGTSASFYRVLVQ